MNPSIKTKLPRCKYPRLAGIAAGLLMALSMGAFGAPDLCGFLVFPAIWLLLLYVFCEDTSASAAPAWRCGLRRGYWFGLWFFGLSLSWVNNVAPGASVPLTLYLALYPAVWAAFSRPLAQRGGWWAFLGIAGSWTALEWLRGWILTGFGWNGLAVAIAPLGEPLLGLAEWVGSTGLSFVLLATVLPFFLASGKNRLLGISLYMLANAIGFGLQQRQKSAPQTTLSVVLVQPNVTQAHRWAVQERELHWANLPEAEQTQVQAAVIKFYDDLEALTKQGIAASENGKADLVLWPESALYYQFNEVYHQEYLDRICGLGNFTLFTGTDIRQDGSYTGAAAVQQKYEDHQLYRKVHLVPFGEYLPLRKQLPFMQTLLGGLLPGDFDTGTSFAPLEAKNANIQLIPSICFEDTVPRVARKFVSNAPQIITNITNDAWFKESEAVSMHFRNSLLRTIELRRPMLRAANTGITAAVTHQGKIAATLPPHTPGVLSTTISVPTSGKQTLYAQYGDWFAALCGLLAAVACLMSRRKTG